VVPLVVAICAKELQPAPEQRSMKYPVTVLSVEALHVNVIWVPDVATAVRFIGAAGGGGSAGDVVGFGPGDAVQPGRIRTRTMVSLK